MLTIANLFGCLHGDSTYAKHIQEMEADLLRQQGEMMSKLAEQVGASLPVSHAVGALDCTHSGRCSKFEMVCVRVGSMQSAVAPQKMPSGRPC
jgi:hypothetical protein